MRKKKKKEEKEDVKILTQLSYWIAIHDQCLYFYLYYDSLSLISHTFVLDVTMYQLMSFLLDLILPEFEHRISSISI